MSDTRTLTSYAKTQLSTGKGMSFLVRQLQRILSNARFGHLTVVLPNGVAVHQLGSEPGPSAKIVIRSWRTVWRLITGGEMAFADSFIDGAWWTPNLAAFLEYGAANEASL